MSSVFLSNYSLSTVYMDLTSLWFKESIEILSLGFSLLLLKVIRGGILSSNHRVCTVLLPFSLENLALVG
jgi:hypothetical protein